MGNIHQNFAVYQRVKLVETSDSTMDGLTGYIANKPQRDPVCDFYIVVLDAQYNGNKAVHMIESCLEPV